MNMSGSGGGIYGMGRAFNLKYRPNGPLKTFIYDRRMPLFGFGPRRPHYGGGFDLMSTNVTYEYNRGFWGNLADIFTGLAAGFGIFSQIRGMFSSNSDIVQGPEESQRKPKPQGAKSDDDAANLKRLQTLAPKMTIISEGDGKFTLLAEDGQYIKNKDYKDAQDWIFNYNKKTETKTPAKESKEPEGTGKGKDAAEGTEGAGSASGAGAAGGAGGSRRSTKVTGSDEVAKSDEVDTESETEKVSESKNKLSHYDVNVKYEIRNVKVRGVKIPGSWHGEAFAEFTDLNGEVHHYRADCKVPGSYDGIKSILEQSLKEQIEADGFKDVKLTPWGTAKASSSSTTVKTGETKKTTETKKYSDKENKSHAYTASVKWVPLKIEKHPLFGYVSECEFRIITSFKDLNGETHTHEATGKSNIPGNCEAKAKANAVEKVQTKIVADGFTNVKV